jgi:plastocyanin
MNRPATAWDPKYLALLVSLLLLGACGGSDSPSDPGDGTEPPAGDDGPVATTSVSVRDNLFDPAAITASAGDTVTWTWSGSEPHNVTWVDADLSDSPTQTSGTHQAAMPGESGELVYYCTIHGTPTSGMRGTIDIE